MEGKGVSNRHAIIWYRVEDRVGRQARGSSQKLLGEDVFAFSLL